MIKRACVQSLKISLLASKLMSNNSYVKRWTVNSLVSNNVRFLSIIPFRNFFKANTMKYSFSTININIGDCKQWNKLEVLKAMRRSIERGGAGFTSEEVNLLEKTEYPLSGQFLILVSDIIERQSVETARDFVKISLSVNSEIAQKIVDFVDRKLSRNSACDGDNATASVGNDSESDESDLKKELKKEFDKMLNELENESIKQDPVEEKVMKPAVKEEVYEDEKDWIDQLYDDQDNGDDGVDYYD